MCFACLDKLRKTRGDGINTNKNSPADENSRDHVPILLGDLVEEIETMAKGCAGDILEAVPMDLKGNTGSGQLIKIGSNLPALPTGFRGKEENRNAFRKGNRCFCFPGSTAREQDHETKRRDQESRQGFLHGMPQIGCSCW